MQYIVLGTACSSPSHCFKGLQMQRRPHVNDHVHQRYPHPCIWCTAGSCSALLNAVKLPHVDACRKRALKEVMYRPRQAK